MPTDNKQKSLEQVNKQLLDHKSRVSRLSANYANKYTERLEDLFANLEQLACSPGSNTPEIRFEIEALRARLLELEKEILENKVAVVVAEGNPPEVPSLNEETIPEIVEQVLPVPDEPAGSPSPILYEREQIGFVFSEDRLQQINGNNNFSDNSPKTTVPLTVRGQPIGDVQLAPPADRAWTAEETEVMKTVAQQVSAQIQSLRLLAETERARTEAESATRRFMHEGWATYLDAIHQNERIGYAYDQTSVTPFIGKYNAETGVQEKVSVMDEQVGAIYLTPDPAHPLTDVDRQMIVSIASQIAQQVESIRLLADASRARAEADEAVRRDTRNSWNSFNEEIGAGAFGFAYDNNQVTPFRDKLPEDTLLTFPLQVRGETIGQLAVTGQVKIPQEEVALATAIAAQTSTHLETLRLNEELQKRAAELLELDRLKSGFLANMSHELRTPLNSILGFTDVILEELDGPLTEVMNNDLHLIQKNGQHLLHLINDVLDMAKITAGRMNLSPERFEIHEILDEVVSITSPMATDKAIQLIVENDDNMNVEVFADRTRIRQVMINLVNNALKFTDKGKVSIQVECQAENILVKGAGYRCGDTAR